MSLSPSTWNSSNNLPPEGHPRRCKQRSRMTGNQCRLWAERGQRFCRSHRKATGINTVKGSYVSTIYRRHLRRTVQEALDAALQEDPSEQIKLYEELALMRMSAAQAVKLWDVATGAYETAEEGKRPELLETSITAGSLMRSALSEVRDTCEKITTMQARSKGFISIHDLAHWMDQIVTAVYRACGDDDLAQKIEQNIRDMVRLPNDESGTSITPDMDVLDMDSTVPKGE